MFVRAGLDQKPAQCIFGGSLGGLLDVLICIRERETFTLLCSLLACRACFSCSRLGRSMDPSITWFWLILYFTCREQTNTDRNLPEMSVVLHMRGVLSFTCRGVQGMVEEAM